MNSMSYVQLKYINYSSLYWIFQIPYGAHEQIPTLKCVVLYLFFLSWSSIFLHQHISLNLRIGVLHYDYALQQTSIITNIGPSLRYSIKYWYTRKEAQPI